MSNTSKLKPNNHLLAYEAAEAKCKENIPKLKYQYLNIQECMDISNTNVDMKLCKQMLERFSECFNVHKPVAYMQLGKHRD